VQEDDIKKAGLKVTVPRLKILELFEAQPDSHMTAEGVYKLLVASGDEIGLATVYRVLNQFVTAGLLIRHHFEEGQAVFELESGAHHDHIVCEQCGHVEEFMDQTIEKQQHKIAESKGFEISDHSLIIYGRCNRKKCPNLKK